MLIPSPLYPRESILIAFGSHDSYSLLYIYVFANISTRRLRRSVEGVYKGRSINAFYIPMKGDRSVSLCIPSQLTRRQASSVFDHSLSREMCVCVCASFSCTLVLLYLVIRGACGSIYVQRGPLETTQILQIAARWFVRVYSNCCTIYIHSSSFGISCSLQIYICIAIRVHVRVCKIFWVIVEAA